MDSQTAIPSSSCDTGVGSTQTEADQDLSPSWLDLVDWTLLDADTWVDGDFGGTSNEVLTNDFDFPGFDGQLFEAKATSMSSKHYAASTQETPELAAHSTQRTESGFLDCPDSISDNEVSGPPEAWHPGRGRSQRPEILLSGGRPALCPSPSPRRTGRLSDLVRKGMKELKHAKGACWRCKILRKKVSYEA